MGVKSETASVQVEAVYNCVMVLAIQQTHAFRVLPILTDSSILVLPSRAFLRPPTTVHKRLIHKRARTALRIRYAPHLRTKCATSYACPLYSAENNSLINQ